MSERSNTAAGVACLLGAHIASALAQRSFPLLHLPTELRALIYTHLDLSTTIEVRNNPIPTHRTTTVRKRPAIASVCRPLRAELSSHLKCTKLILKGRASHWDLDALLPVLSHVQRLTIETLSTPDGSIAAVLKKMPRLQLVSFSTTATAAFAPALNDMLRQQQTRRARCRARRSVSDEDAAIVGRVRSCLRGIGGLGGGMRLDALLKEGERGYAIVLEVEVWVRVDANWRSRERVNVVVDIDRGIVLEKRRWDGKKMD